VIPACVAILLTRGWRGRLIFGWLIGVVGSALGLVASYYLDLPTGPAVVVILGAILVLAWVIDLMRNVSDAKAPKT
jgi:ABC-type Mn2+/Zn2+ transport system permease subunit